MPFLGEIFGASQPAHSAKTNKLIRELAEWWWSNPDRGFLGTTLTCANYSECLAYRAPKRHRYGLPYKKDTCSKGYQIGSGAMDRACKHLVKERPPRRCRQAMNSGKQRAKIGAALSFKAGIRNCPTNLAKIAVRYALGNGPGRENVRSYQSAFIYV